MTSTETPEGATYVRVAKSPGTATATAAATETEASPAPTRAAARAGVRARQSVTTAWRDARARRAVTIKERTPRKAPAEGSVEGGREGFWQAQPPSLAVLLGEVQRGPVVRDYAEDGSYAEKPAGWGQPWTFLWFLVAYLNFVLTAALYGMAWDLRRPVRLALLLGVLAVAYVLSTAGGGA